MSTVSHLNAHAGWRGRSDCGQAACTPLLNTATAGQIGSGSTGTGRAPAQHRHKGASSSPPLCQFSGIQSLSKLSSSAAPPSCHVAAGGSAEGARFAPSVAHARLKFMGTAHAPAMSRRILAAAGAAAFGAGPTTGWGKVGPTWRRSQRATLSWRASIGSGMGSDRASVRKGLRWRQPLRDLEEGGGGRRSPRGPLGEKQGRQMRDLRAAVVGSELSSTGGAMDIIANLGLDTLTFLAATVIIVPAFKSFKASPILGFLLSGVALNELGLIRNISDVKALSELGILFLLFEMGLELSIERLRALAKFAFGIGLPQVILTTLAFTLFELPTGNALGTRILEFFFGARPDLVNIRSLDEAIVIGAALSLSSSAFVLQLLSEKGELATRVGSATLGILLLQDIAVVPLLVILPILESGDFTDDNLFPLLAAAGLKSLLGLGVLLLMGRLFLRRFFEFVAESRSSEAFVALCLLTVTGTSLITSKLGFSDSLGAFLAGALLAETNYRTQVEADIRPFRGLLLGLFFVTTGTSIDLGLLAEEWPNILALLGGLIGVKTAILTALGPRVGLSLSDSLRTGLLLSQGGEFAFVVFALANQLGVLPEELNRLLIIVVVLSMALTPLLDSVGRRLAEFVEDALEAEADAEAAKAAVAAGEAPSAALSPGERKSGSGARGSGKGGNSSNAVGSGKTSSDHGHGFGAAEPIVLLGFNQQGQVLANMLSSPLAGIDGGGWPYISFDLNPKRVRAARNLGFPVLYGDGSRVAVLQSAGILQPKAVIVVYSSRNRSVESVERLHHSFPSVPIFARATDLAHMLELQRAGATDVVLESAETSLRLGSMLLQDLGVMRDDVVFLRGLMREAMFKRAEETLRKRRSGSSSEAEEEGLSSPVMKPPPLPDLLNDASGVAPTRAAAAAAALGVSGYSTAALPSILESADEASRALAAATAELDSAEQQSSSGTVKDDNGALASSSDVIDGFPPAVATLSYSSSTVDSVLVQNAAQGSSDSPGGVAVSGQTASQVSPLEGEGGGIAKELVDEELDESWEKFPSSGQIYFSDGEDYIDAGIPLGQFKGAEYVDKDVSKDSLKKRTFGPYTLD